MVRSITLAAAFVLAAAAGPAWGQAVSAEGAAAMRAAISEGLQRNFPTVEGSTEFRWAGELQVIPAGDRYDVTLPALTVVSPEDTRFEVGTIRLTVAPRPDAAYAVEATLPTSMTMRNGDTLSGNLTIGRQRFTGVWSAAVENFVSADMAYGDLALVGTKDGGALRIASLTATQELQPDGPGTWGGPFAAALGDLTLTDPQKETVLKIGGATMEASYGRIDLARVAQVKELAARHAAAGTEPPALQLLPLLGGMLGEASLRTRISGLSAGSGESRVTFDQASFSMGMRDIDRETSTTTLGFQGDGLKITPLPTPKQFMPERFDVQVSLGRLPNAALGQSILALAALDEQEKAQGKPEGADNSAREALVTATGKVLIDAASQAGTELRIDRLALDTPATSGSITGAARVMSQAALSAVGGAEVVLRGLDAAANALKPKPGAKPDPEAQQTLGMVSMLQALGQQGKDAAGKDVRTYKIDLTEAGQILLNGADMSALMGMAAPPAAAPQQPQRAPKKN
ncbi:MAG TPA: hypothetical protein VD978_36370 [Azospirillum sp.]|nr:hypothetical protein [Azospirillum sp.]